MQVRGGVDRFAGSHGRNFTHSGFGCRGQSGVEAGCVGSAMQANVPLQGGYETGARCRPFPFPVDPTGTISSPSCVDTYPGGRQ
jgi:hypothetical protein